MTLRDVEKKIKSDFKVGPSKETIRAAPLTRKCLGNKLVRKSIGDGDDEYAQLIH
jgi:hypothetical protein